MKRVAVQIRLELFDKCNELMKNNPSIDDAIIEEIWIPLYDAVLAVVKRAVENEVS